MKTLTLEQLIISIHALRVEGDVVNCYVDIINGISIHALRVEGDLATAQKHCRRCLFQSTPSVGRATLRRRTIDKFNRISIHALRGEGDGCRNAPRVK